MPPRHCPCFPTCTRSPTICRNVAGHSSARSAKTHSSDSPQRGRCSLSRRGCPACPGDPVRQDAPGQLVARPASGSHDRRLRTARRCWSRRVRIGSVSSRRATLPPPWRDAGHRRAWRLWETYGPMRPRSFMPRPRASGSGTAVCCRSTISRGTTGRTRLARHLSPPPESSRTRHASSPIGVERLAQIVADQADGVERVGQDGRDRRCRRRRAMGR